MRNIWKTDNLKRAVVQLRQDIKSIRLSLAVLAIYMIITHSVFGTVCPWAILTHFPCPACGLTRAGLCVAALHFRDAFRWNAMIGLWLPYLLYLAVERYVLARKPRMALAIATVIGGVTCVYFGFRVWKGMIPQDILPLRLYSFPTIW